MKSEFKAKFLQHMINSRKSEKGFTLIELLVVIIIIGILAAIALPSFLNQAAKAKQSEAKSYIGAVNRSQQAYRIENNSFATTFTVLEVGLNTDTTNYGYTVRTATGAAGTVEAQPKDPTALKSYAGGVFIQGDGQTRAVSCESLTVNVTAAEPPAASSCAANFKVL